VSYRVHLGPGARQQVDGIPQEALEALADRLEELAEMPWDAHAPRNRLWDRHTEFGQGRGLVWFLADDNRELIIVTRILWVG
jgi:plasmid stabilization system protein ParE